MRGRESPPWLGAAAHPPSAPQVRAVGCLPHVPGAGSEPGRGTQGAPESRLVPLAPALVPTPWPRVSVRLPEAQGRSPWPTCPPCGPTGAVRLPMLGIPAQATRERSPADPGRSAWSLRPPTVREPTVGVGAMEAGPGGPPEQVPPTGLREPGAPREAGSREDPVAHGARGRGGCPGTGAAPATRGVTVRPLPSPPGLSSAQHPRRAPTGRLLGAPALLGGCSHAAAPDGPHGASVAHHCTSHARPADVPSCPLLRRGSPCVRGTRAGRLTHAHTCAHTEPCEGPAC